MKQQPNTDKLSNELAESSLFFKRPEPTPTPPAATAPQESRREAQDPERSNGRTGERPLDPPNARTGRRRARRYSFEIYEDQIERIKRLALEDQLQGGELSQSEIVRTALDRYLAELEQGRA